MTSITLELDPAFQEKLEKYASEHNQSLSDSAYYLLNKWYEQTENEDEDSDEPYTEEEERLFYSPSNLAAIDESIKQLNEGKIVEVTLEELKAMIK